MANLKGIFHVQQRPGTTQVVLCGFGSECNIVSIEALSECEPLDTSDTLQLLQTLQQTAQQAQQAQQAQAGQQAPPQAQQGEQQPQQQGEQPGEQAQQQVQQQGEDPGEPLLGSHGPSSSASCAAGQRSASPSPRAQASAPRVAAGGVDGQLTYQMMSERMSDLCNWVLRESSNLKYSAVPREQLPPATAGYGLRTDWVLHGHGGAVDLASCQADCIATVSFDGTAKLWRVPSERPPAGSVTASVGPGQGPVPVLSAAATYVDAPEPGASAPPLCCVTLAADCSQLATGGNDNQVKLWDAERAVLTRRLLGHDGWVWHVMPLQGGCFVVCCFVRRAAGCTEGPCCCKTNAARRTMCAWRLLGACSNTWLVVGSLHS
jgi:WD40 repeat protein